MTSHLLRWTALAGLAALVALALPAAAEYYEGKPDCPPDMACTLSAPTEGAAPEGNATAGDSQAYGPDDCIDCTKAPEGRGPADCEYCRGDDGAGDGPTYGDCGGEVCAYDGVKGPPPPANGGTCMDGAEVWEICDREVHYLDGGTANGGPPEPIADRDGGASGDNPEVQSLGANAAAVPGVVGLAFAVSAGAVLLVARRKP